MTPYDKFKLFIDSTDDRDMLLTQLRLLQMEIDTSTATLILRKDFNNPIAQEAVVKKFFLQYDLMTPEQRQEFYDTLTDEGKKYTDAWMFAGIINYPYLADIAGIYLASITGIKNESIQTHLEEAQKLLGLVVAKAGVA